MSSADDGRRIVMEQEQLTSTITIDASPEAVFDVLTDPSTHAAVDGTGWVRAPHDPERLSEVGQFFRMEMYHPNHPDGIYEVANRIEVFEAPAAIAWKPGTGSPERGDVQFGGWLWRYDLEATGASQTTVTLTYDWSRAEPEAREVIQFPPFGVDHLERSLQHLAALATG